MTPRTRRPDAGQNRPAMRRRLLLMAIPALVLVLALVALLVARSAAGGSKPNAAPGAARSSVATGAQGTPAGVSPPLPTPTPTGPTANATDLPPDLPPVPLSATASPSGGVETSLPTIQGIRGSATGPGNISGPAVRVTVRLTNDTGAPLSLGGVVVNMYYGTGRTPASPLDDPSAAPFTGMLAAARSSDGVYVFTVPTDARDQVTISVENQAGAPVVVFTGSVA